MSDLSLPISGYNTEIRLDNPINVAVSEIHTAVNKKEMIIFAGETTSWRLRFWQRSGVKTLSAKTNYRYNGMPNGCCDDDFPWGKTSSIPTNTKGLYVCHAEMNAILNKNSSDVRDCTIFVGLFPCNECAKIIIQSGIKEVVYLSDEKAHKSSYQASKKMFNAAGVRYWQYTPQIDKIVIDFTKLKLSDSPSKLEIQKLTINDNCADVNVSLQPLLAEELCLRVSTNQENSLV
ncbi:unnamed protein product [Diatraea saccharalis]|uniref:dCMP deaminase n=1 Tax=Diatraea saccharalis TaxID=40085 RepID=A0A9N9N4C9_9NEOP|nr:unnamed protein product [Diatraea saccharalis]